MLDSILGGLYGQALGDAWAMPALLNPSDTRKRYGWITSFLPGPQDHPVHHGLPTGKVTDDTEQAFALAEVIIEEGRVTPEGVARAIVSWYDRVGGDACPFVGPSTRRAVQAFKRGADLSVTGLHGDTNGASMRISPIGLIHPGDLQAVVDDVEKSCIPTHNTDIAISGASAIAGAISKAMLPDSTMEEIVEAGIQAAELGRQRGPVWIGASVPRRIRLAVDIARQNSRSTVDRIQDLYDLVGASLAIAESVPAAFGVFVMGEGDPVQTAVFSAALSGDADTVGAMACAICGAWRGAAAFPPHVVEILRTANPEFDFDRIAQGLYHLVKTA